MIRLLLLLALLPSLALAQPARVGPLGIQNNLSELLANGSGAQAAAQANLGLGSIATQSAGAVSITGGTIGGLTSLGVNGILTHHAGTETVSAAVAPAFDFLAGFTGTAIGNPSFVYSGLKLVVSPDSLALPNTNQFFNGFQIQHNYGSTTAMTGNRQAMQINLVQAGTTGNTIASGTNGFYTALQTYSQASFNDNGTGLTSGTAHGRSFGAAFATQLNTGATNWYQATALELNAQIQTGASSAIKTALSIASVGASNVTQGTLVDAGIWMYSANGAALVKNAILIGGGGLNSFPIDPAGCYICDDTTGSVTATTAYGIHWTGAFTTASISVPGLVVGPLGATTFSASGTALTVTHAMSVGGLATLTGGFVATAGSVQGKISGADSSFLLGAASVKTYSGAASAAQISFLSQHILRGTVASGSQSYAQFWASDDGAVAPTSGGQLAIVSILDTVTANAIGNRWGLDITVANSAALTAGAVAFGGVRAQVEPAFNMGGTDLTIGGSLGLNFGANITANATGTATFLRNVTGMEIDIGISTGASAYAKEGLKIVVLGTDAVAGAVWDYGLSIQGQNGQAAGKGLTTGLVFGGNGGFGLVSTATMINAFVGNGTMLADKGIDFSGVTFTTAFLKSTGFLVDPTGIVTAASYKAGAVAGVSCAANTVTLLTEVVTNGIVTHC